MKVVCFLSVDLHAIAITKHGATGDEEETVTVKVQTTRERKLAARKAAQTEPEEDWIDLRVYARGVCLLSLQDFDI